MEITDKQKADIIRRYFITGELYDFESAKNLSQDEKDFREKQNRIYRRFKRIKRHYGSSQDCGVFQFTNSVYNKLVSDVASRTFELQNARNEANRVFNIYMYYRNLVKSGELFYTDETVRKNFNGFKTDWIKASKEVQRIKCLLKQDEIILNKFMEFMKLI